MLTLISVYFVIFVVAVGLAMYNASKRGKEETAERYGAQFKRYFKQWWRGDAPVQYSLHKIRPRSILGPWRTDPSTSWATPIIASAVLAKCGGSGTASRGARKTGGSL